MDMGLDPAPFVTLRLTDTEATRELWPHKFEVLYKVRGTLGAECGGLGGSRNGMLCNVWRRAGGAQICWGAAGSSGRRCMRCRRRPRWLTSVKQKAHNICTVFVTSSCPCTLFAPLTILASPPCVPVHAERAAMLVW